MVKRVFKSKTMWFSILLAIGGILEQQQQVITDLAGQKNVGWIMMVISMVVAVLRIVTTKPLKEKE